MTSQDLYLRLQKHFDAVGIIHTSRYSEEAKKMNPNNDGQKTYNMYVGEIIK